MGQSFSTIEKATRNAELVVWDFDHTLVRLDVDWTGLKKKTAEQFVSDYLKGEKTPSLFEIEQQAKKNNKRDQFIETIKMFEKNTPYEPIVDMLDFVRSKKNMIHTIFSDNTRETIFSIIEREQLIDCFDYVVAKENVANSKPKIDGLISIQKKYPNIRTETWVYVGDSWKDKQAAEEFGISFFNVSDCLSVCQ